MKYLFLATALILQTHLAWGQASTPLEYNENDDTSSLENIYQKKEIHLKNEKMIETRDRNTNVIVSRHYTKEDDFIFYLRGHLSENLYVTRKYLAIEGSFAKKIQNFWLQFLVSQSTSEFEIISENRTNGPNTSNSLAEENFVRPNNARQRLFTIGAGISYRWILELDFLETHNIFQTTSAYLTFHQLDENFRSTKYDGLGLRTDYGIHYRAHANFSFGPLLSYNLAIVSRDGSLRERNNDRRLFLSYLTLAFEVGYFF